MLVASDKEFCLGVSRYLCLSERDSGLYLLAFEIILLNLGETWDSAERHL